MLSQLVNKGMDTGSEFGLWIGICSYKFALEIPVNSSL